MSEMTPDQIEFTNAFNRQRLWLAGFAKCQSKEELTMIKDGLYLGLAKDLRLPAYQAIEPEIVMSEKVATASVVAANASLNEVITKNDSNSDEAAKKESKKNTDELYYESIKLMIKVAKESSEELWKTLESEVNEKALSVESDLEGIWQTLEKGRLEWLNALNGAQKIKETLKKGLEKDKEHTAGDISDAKMIWMYALSLNISILKDLSKAWSEVVKLKDPTQPLVGYQPDLWDPRKDEWRVLDINVQAAAERGGSSIEEAWNA